MTVSVQDLLRRFEALTDQEKHELALAVIRWWGRVDRPSPTDDELVSSADTILQALDREEEGGG